MLAAFKFNGTLSQMQSDEAAIHNDYPARYFFVMLW